MAIKKYNFHTESKENLRNEICVNNSREMNVLLHNTKIVIVFYFSKLINVLKELNPTIRYYVPCNKFFMNTSAKLNYSNIICNKVKYLDKLSELNSMDNVILDSIVKTPDVIKFASEKGVKMHMVYSISNAILVLNNAKNSKIILKICDEGGIGISPTILCNNINKLDNIYGACIDVNNIFNLAELCDCLKLLKLKKNVKELYVTNIDINNVGKYEITRLGFNVNIILPTSFYEKFMNVYTKIASKKKVIRNCNICTYYMCDMSLVDEKSNRYELSDNSTNSYIIDDTSLRKIAQINDIDANEGDFIKIKDASVNQFNKNDVMVWTK